MDDRTAALSGVDVTGSAGDGSVDDGPAQLVVHPEPSVATVTVDAHQLDGGGVMRLGPRLQYDPPGEESGMERSDDLYEDTEDEGYEDSGNEEEDRGS